jgi:membrane-bound lytic murein transglycosylase MltF
VGLFSVIVVDDWMARMWAQVWKGVKVNEGAVLNTGGVTGWAIRKDSPKLEALLGEFYTGWVLKQGHQKDRSWNYNRKVKQLRDPSGSEDYKRFQSTLELFKKYGEKYGFDPLMLAAQGYQESQLNQEAKSHVGAIGVMQVMPATGAELKVGDIKLTEPNVHAGAKYMDKLLTKYFPDAKFNALNRELFGFASYNCGPGNISRMRKEAVKQGLDPDKWFNNVEIVTAKKIGIETTTYVRNIFKYYVAYKMMVDVEEEKKKALEGIDKGPLVTIERKS